MRARVACLDDLRRASSKHEDSGQCQCSMKRSVRDIWSVFHRRGSKPAVAVLYQGTLSQEFSVYQVSDPGAAAGGHRGSGLL